MKKTEYSKYESKRNAGLLKIILEKMLEKFHTIIRSVWLISDVSENEIIIGMIVDDTKAREADIKELELFAVKLSDITEQKYNKKVYFIFELLTDYFEKIMQNRADIFSELKSSIVLYDPTGFLRPIQKLVAEGNILGTKESIIRLIISVKKHLRNIEDIKVEVLGKLYESVIDSIEAVLIAKGLEALTPKQAITQLEKFSKKRILSQRYVDYYKQIYSYYKDYEHGNIKSIDGKKLDSMITMADKFIDRMKDLCRELKRKGE